MSNYTKAELIKILKKQAEETLKLCEQAEFDKSVTVEQLEKRASKMMQ